MALTPEEVPILAALLEKMEWPIPHEVFRALCKNTVTVPIELVIWNGREEVFLIHRKDEDYEGYHLPGTVLRDNESVMEATERLIEGEVPFTIGYPKALGWIEVRRGTGNGENHMRHEISLLHSARTVRYRPNPLAPKGAGFFSPEALPNTLPHHRRIIQLAEKLRQKEQRS